MLRGAADRDDVTSEVFLAVFERLATFTGTEANFRSWVFAIAHNKVADVDRREMRRPWWEGDQDAAPDREGGNVEAEAPSYLGTRQVRDLLDGLPDIRGEVLVLRIVASAPCSEPMAGTPPT